MLSQESHMDMHGTGHIIFIVQTKLNFERDSVPI